ncbi:MAG: DNA adenine methylase [Lentimicrobiaceae bacterium]|nr:DNA adenine methylase [Lentimicrobiaceae bacterium]
MKKNFSEKNIYVDLFGGSGLLSHFVKQVYPNAVVVYNDYDNFVKRLKNIDKTNKIINECRQILNKYPNEKKITDSERKQIINVLEKHNKKGFVDYITLSASLLFSANYVTSLDELKTKTLYNNIVQKDYSCNGYLHGITIVRTDYKELYNKYKNRKNVVFLIDPPYLSTDNKTYLSEKYWTLKDYLDILPILKNTNFFYFTSNKSDIVELLEWLAKNANLKNSLYGIKKVKMKIGVNKDAYNEDIMLFKKL